MLLPPCNLPRNVIATKVARKFAMCNISFTGIQSYKGNRKLLIQDCYFSSASFNMCHFFQSEARKFKKERNSSIKFGIEID